MYKEKYRQLINEYGTNDPLELAEHLGVIVNFRPLGNLNGYYLYSHGVKIVTVNSDMSHETKQHILMCGLIEATQEEQNTAFCLIGDTTYKN